MVALVAVFFTLKGGETIVALLLMGYSLVTQLFPSLVLSLAQRNVATREGAMAGIIAGVATVAVVSLTGANFHTLPWLPPQIQDLNIGIVALVGEFHRADRGERRDPASRRARARYREIRRRDRLRCRWSGRVQPLPKAAPRKTWVDSSRSR